VPAPPTEADTQQCALLSRVRARGGSEERKASCCASATVTTAAVLARVHSDAALVHADTPLVQADTSPVVCFTSHEGAAATNQIDTKGQHPKLVSC
jgi:hypothetical protein